jgi:penicillin V acylase-like amidase (Ntn superfamily)
MKTRNLYRALLYALLSTSLVLMSMQSAMPCSRATYLGKDGQIVTGRSMDWLEDMHSNLWVFPRGMARDSGMGDQSVKWTSKYGSVIVTGYDVATVDGMNEQGLVANMLFLVESEFSPLDDKRPAMTISAWAQYVLDNFATVNEVVVDARKEAFRMVTAMTPVGRMATLHLSISDASGDSAIFEYIGGKLVIHHSKQYQVMTNSPTYDAQLAMNEYWKQIGGTVMLPGTNRAADRFARASFYINATKQSSDPREAVAAVFSVMRNVSVPRGISTPNQPNISATIWRTVADQKTKVYFFENTFSPSIVWVYLNKINFKPGSGVRKLTLDGKPDLGGDQTSNFEKTEAFRFLAPH